MKSRRTIIACRTERLQPRKYVPIGFMVSHDRRTD